MHVCIQACVVCVDTHTYMHARVCACVANPIHFLYTYCSYNGISSLPPLELWRFPSLKALFLQGMFVHETVKRH